MNKALLVSDESLNSYNIRVMTAGGEFDRFRKNPIMLFNHIRAVGGKTDDVLPIGTWIDLKIEGDKIYATPVFDEKDEFAAKISGKFERGIIRSASIGLKVIEMSQEGVDEQGRPVFVITKWQLMEISLVDIPSNENAVAFYDENDQPLELSAVIAKFSAAHSKPKFEVTMNYQFLPGLLGLATGATEDQVKAAVQALLDENKKLKADAKAALSAQIDQLIDDAEAGEKILPSEKEHYRRVLNADFESGKAIIEGLPKRVKLSDLPKKRVEGVASGQDVQYNGMTFSELQKKDPVMLGRLKERDFQTFNDLYKSEYGVDYRR